jgi:hypothetical protein
MSLLRSAATGSPQRQTPPAARHGANAPKPTPAERDLLAISERTDLDLRKQVERVIEQMRKMSCGQRPDAEGVNGIARPRREQA